MKHGVLLFAHGARDRRWAAPFEAIADQVRDRSPDAVVRLCFLEFMAPDLPEAAREAIRLECRRLVVVPLFLGAGGHVQRDLPRLVEQLRHDHPGIVIEMRGAVGEHPSVIDAIARLAVDAIASADASVAAPP